MRYSTLPNTDIKVSKICLGTMTWGQQNTESQGHEQLNFAIDHGVNFIDTAELYPVPAKKETQGKTEEVIGTWLQKRGKRDDVIIASKIAGPADFTKHIRTEGFSKKGLEDAIHASLQRLQTDYIDLYQLHWPDRNSNFFGKLDYVHQEEEQWNDNFHQIVHDLETFVKSGKIRHIGLSNESPFGIMRYLDEGKAGSSRLSTVQNPFSLLNRKDEIGLSELLLRSDIGYLAYSPLGFGQLTGKYLDGYPEDSRVAIFPNYSRYHNERSFEATRSYNEIAKKHNISLTQMALAFVNDRPFMTSTIIGATKIAQLAENIGSIDVQLSDSILEEINAVHADNPNPAP